MNKRPYAIEVQISLEYGRGDEVVALDPPLKWLNGVDIRITLYPTILSIESNLRTLDIC